LQASTTLYDYRQGHNQPTLKASSPRKVTSCPFHDLYPADDPTEPTFPVLYSNLLRKPVRCLVGFLFCTLGRRLHREISASLVRICVLSCSFIISLSHPNSCIILGIRNICRFLVFTSSVVGEHPTVNVEASRHAGVFVNIRSNFGSPQFWNCDIPFAPNFTGKVVRKWRGGRGGLTSYIVVPIPREPVTRK
jgi:hypothetical protein